MKKRRILLILGMLALFWLGVSRLEAGRQAQGVQQLETVLRRTAASCYAAEGFYPPDVAYMVEHYALRYDEKAYAIGYEVFAANLMPEITVMEK